MHGLLVLDKPRGRTSRDTLNRAKSWFPRKTKLGHTGTLDPLATGVLVVCIGSATRLAEFVQAMGKSYDARILLGSTSSTDDADGDLQVNASAVPPSREDIEEALAGFVGAIHQVPPSISALMVGGHRAHELARKGKDVPLVARPVVIESICVRNYEWPHLDVSIDCGKGTYVRSIARDLGEKLGVGGLVQTLRRTRVGPFRAEDGVGLEASVEEVRAKIRPATVAIAGMPRVRISLAAEELFRRGQAVEPPVGAPTGEVAVMGESDWFIGIGFIDRGLQPRIVLARRPI
jgi:tRNA pseudouridine55 synthase